MLTAARTILSAFLDANCIYLWKIRNRLARIPNAFSATRLAPGTAIAENSLPDGEMPLTERFDEVSFLCGKGLICSNKKKKNGTFPSIPCTTEENEK